jgi:hypothetical protein
MLLLGENHEPLKHSPPRGCAGNPAPHWALVRRPIRASIPVNNSIPVGQRTSAGRLGLLAATAGWRKRLFVLCLFSLVVRILPTRQAGQIARRVDAQIGYSNI